jgi:hypothetical protein
MLLNNNLIHKVLEILFQFQYKLIQQDNYRILPQWDLLHLLQFHLDIDQQGKEQGSE